VLPAIGRLQEIPGISRNAARGHGANPELGSVEICRLVPKTA
jgi:hypothetical protein